MRDVDHDGKGAVDAVRVATWSAGSDAGLSAWRVDLAGRVGRSVSLSMWFEDQPVSLSTVVLRPQLAPVTMAPTGKTTMDVGDASSFERFAPQWRWLLHRLGLFDRDVTPLRGVGGGICEPFDPWVGRPSAPVGTLLEQASELDRRLGLVDAVVDRERDASFRRGEQPGPRVFDRVQRKLDSGLFDDLSSFVEGLRSRGTSGLVDWSSGYLNKRASFSACFEANGEMVYELMRNNHRGSYVHVDDWSGHRVSDLVRWLSDWEAHPSWAVLDDEAREVWYRHAAVPGELAMPRDEAEVYELTGEPLPYAWDNQKLAAWAAERWP